MHQAACCPLASVGKGSCGTAVTQESSWRIIHGKERAHGVLLYHCQDTSKLYGARRLFGALRAEQSTPARTSPRVLTLHEKRGWFHAVSLQRQRTKAHKGLTASFGTSSSSTYGLHLGLKKTTQGQIHSISHTYPTSRFIEKEPWPSSHAPKLPPSFPLLNYSPQRWLVSDTC